MFATIAPWSCTEEAPVEAMLPTAPHEKYGTRIGREDGRHVAIEQGVELAAVLQARVQPPVSGIKIRHDCIPRISSTTTTTSSTTAVAPPAISPRDFHSSALEELP